MAQQSWLLLFAFSPSLFFLFFSLAVGKVFSKAFRISGLDKRKGRWEVDQDFHGNFKVNVTFFFFCLFSGVLDWVVLILVWFERSLHSTQVSRQSCPWPLKLLMPQAVERTWICTGGYGWLRAKRVNLMWLFYDLQCYHTNWGHPDNCFLYCWLWFWPPKTLSKHFSACFTHSFRKMVLTKRLCTISLFRSWLVIG